MKKITALAALTLVLSACDPYAKEPGGTPSITYVALLNASLDEEGPTFAMDADARVGATVFIVKANVLLDGASIEATPQSCWNDGWMTVASTIGTGVPAGSWYTCYYPSTATEGEPGGSIWIYHSATQDPAAADYETPAPTDTDVSDPLGPSDYTYTGTAQAKGGGALAISTSVSVGRVTVDNDADPATDLPVTAPGGATINLTAALENRVGSTIAWEIVGAVATVSTSTTILEGDEVTTTGTLSATAGASVTYTPPAALDALVTEIEVTLRAEENRGCAHEVTIVVAVP